MLKRREIELQESLSKINYNNAITYFTNCGIKGTENNDIIAPYDNAIKKYLDLLLK